MGIARTHAPYTIPVRLFSCGLLTVPFASRLCHSGRHASAVMFAIIYASVSHQHHQQRQHQQKVGREANRDVHQSNHPSSIYLCTPAS